MTSADESCRRILVADDDDETRWLVATVLAASGFAVEAAADGEEALERIRRRQPDLVSDSRPAGTETRPAPAWPTVALAAT